MAEDARSIDDAYQRDWPRYFDFVQDKPPRDTVLLALRRFAEEGVKERRAIDLACGEGRDTRAILAAGSWSVASLDAHGDAVRRTRASLSPEHQPRCVVRQAAMEDVPRLIPETAAVHLVNASFALPFCQPASFPDLWEWIENILVIGGRFSGQFFGIRDDWSRIRPASHFEADQLRDLLINFMLERFDEVEQEGDDAMGGRKHHHVFHIVARRRE